MTIRPVRNNFGELNKNPLISVAKISTDVNNRTWLDLLQKEIEIQYESFQKERSVEQLLEMRDILNTIIEVLDPTLNDQWQESQVKAYGNYSDRCVAIIPDIPPMPAQEQSQEESTTEDTFETTDEVVAE